MRTSGKGIERGIRAARSLAEACRSGSARGENSARLELVRYLALVVERELEAVGRSAAERPLGGTTNPDLLTEAALRCADLATLAACNAGPALPEAGAVVRLAGRAARDLLSDARFGMEELEGEHSDYLLRDARGAEWRVNLAARQVGLSGG